MIQGFKERWHHMSRRADAPARRWARAWTQCVVRPDCRPTVGQPGAPGAPSHAQTEGSCRVAQLGQSYLAKRDRLSMIESRMPQRRAFATLTFIEEAATTAQVREQITGMQPHVQSLAQGYQETAVDLRLEGVQLPRIIGVIGCDQSGPL